MTKAYNDFLLENTDSLMFTEGWDEDYSHIDNQLLPEKLITFGKQAYPRFGHVVIMAGGAGSGKGFIKSQLFGIEGKTFDVDELKKMMAKKSRYLKELERTLKQFHADGKIKKIPDVYGRDASMTLFREPAIVSAMHLTAERLKLPKRVQKSFFINLIHKPADRKPNLIFDVTLKNMTKLYNLVDRVGGYDKKNIHLVWIVNDLSVAKKQNLARPRVVPEDILVDTHKGAARTFSDIIEMGDRVRKYFDGKIVVVPNKSGVDNVVKTSPAGGYYFEKADYVVLKEPGESINRKAITDQLRRKLKSYVPKGTLNI